MNKERIAQNLREIRGNRTQQEMAELLNTTTSAVGNYEAAVRIPRDEVKVRYANISGKSVEEIFFLP